jgi:bifunctional NMN adenylyltransferase/nudix hydrolase
MKKKIGVFIGRLQPVHNAHLAAIKLALSEVDHLIIVLGSDCTAKTIKNPWTSVERRRMLNACISDDVMRKNVTVIWAKDYLYNDNMWLTALQCALSTVTVTTKNDSRTYDLDDCDVTLYGHDKDRSTFYLHLFPKWNFKETGDLGNVSATMVRECYFRKDLLTLKRLVPAPVWDVMKADMQTDEYNRLHDEWNHVVSYKELWKDAPFPPTFVTVDAVVIKSGHVLVVRRGAQPGKGLIALPGGFLNAGEKIIDGCMRELKEETRISVNKDELYKRVVDQRVFDHPDRSLRGRTITHAFCIDLGSGPLPKVQGDDDADKAWWMPLRDVLRQEEQFFEDHWHIIQFFVSKF